MKFPYISMMKTCGLLGVIFLHCTLYFITPIPFWMLYADKPAGWANVLFQIGNYTLITSFLFASGFLLAKTCSSPNRTLPQLLQGRFQRLFLPWLGIGLLWNAPLYTLFHIPAYGHPADTTLLESWKAVLIGYFNDHLWFLPVLFISSVFWLLIWPRIKNHSPFWGIFIAVTAALAIQNFASTIRFLCLNQTAGPILYVFCGMLMYRYHDTVDAQIKKSPFLIGAILLLAAVIPSMFAAANVYAGWATNLFYSLLIYVVFFFLANSLYTKLRSFRIYAWFEDKSFLYYLFHMPIPLLVFIWLYPKTTVSPMWFALFNFTITLAVTTIIALVATKLQALLYGQKMGKKAMKSKTT